MRVHKGLTSIQNIGLYMYVHDFFFTSLKRQGRTFQIVLNYGPFCTLQYSQSRATRTALCLPLRKKKGSSVMKTLSMQSSELKAYC